MKRVKLICLNILLLLLTSRVKSQNSNCKDPLCLSCNSQGSFCGECRKSYHPDSEGKCKECFGNCIKCSNGIFCEECEEGFSLSSDKRSCKGGSFMRILLTLFIIMIIIILLISLFIFIKKKIKEAKKNKKRKRKEKLNRPEQEMNRRYDPRSVTVPVALPANFQAMKKSDFLPDLEEIKVPKGPLGFLGNNLAKFSPQGMIKKNHNDLLNKCSIVGIVDFGNNVDLEAKGLIEEVYRKVNLGQNGGVGSFEIVQIPREKINREFTLWFFIDENDKESIKETQKELNRGLNGSVKYPKFWVFNTENKKYVSKNGVKELFDFKEKAYGRWMDSS